MANNQKIVKAIKAIPTMVGTAYDATKSYRLLDYIVVDGVTVYTCKKVDKTTMTCVGHPLTDTDYWDKSVDLSGAIQNIEASNGKATVESVSMLSDYGCIIKDSDMTEISASKSYFLVEDAVNGWHFFGDGMKDDPDPSHANANKRITTNIPKNVRPFVIRLKNCKCANYPFRSLAVYRKDDGKLLFERAVKGDMDFILQNSNYVIIGNFDTALILSFDNFSRTTTLPELRAIALKNKSDIEGVEPKIKESFAEQRKIDSLLPVSNNFRPLSLYKDLGKKIINHGYYKFGQEYGVRPAFVSDDVPGIYEATVVCSIPSSTDPKQVRIIGLKTANFDFRSLAIYRLSTKELLYETSCVGSLDFRFNESVIVVGNYTGIYVSMADERQGTPKTVEEYIDSAVSKANVISGSKLKGKQIWTLFDSLGHNNDWQNTFVNLSGCIFDASKNSGVISYGGTQTGTIESNCGQARAKKLVSFKDSEAIDYLFIENVNDINSVNNAGTLQDTPWMQGDGILGHSIFDSRAIAEEFIASNFENLVASVAQDNRKKGNFFTFPYKATTQNAYRIAILSKATSNGMVYVVKDSLRYGINITTDMSIEDIVKAIEMYDFGAGWTDTNNGDGSITIGYYTTTSSVISFDAGTTGIKSEVSKTYNSGQLVRYFTGLSASEWTDMNKWVSSLTLSSLYKGLLEYLTSNLKETKIYWFLPTYYNIRMDGTDEFVKSDGSFDINAYMESSLYVKKKKLFDLQKSISELYSIPVVDIDSNCGINLFNAPQFYLPSNVHPKKTGYDRWAETLYTMLG